MAWNGSGVFTRTNGVNTGTEAWQDDAAAATKILASRHDTHDQDLAAGIQACITKNGESKPTADFLPNVTATYDLGSSSAQWVDGHFSGTVNIDSKPALTKQGGVYSGRIPTTTGTGTVDGGSGFTYSWSGTACTITHSLGTQNYTFTVGMKGSVFQGHRGTTGTNDLIITVETSAAAFNFIIIPD